MGKTLGYVFGVVFILVAVLGFVQNPIVGDMGFFHTDAVHNAVHLLFGLILLVGASKGESASSKTMKVVGAIYFLLAVIGFLQFGTAAGDNMLLGLVGTNGADNWLHLVLGVVIFAAGSMGKKS